MTEEEIDKKIMEIDKTANSGKIEEAFVLYFSLWDTLKNELPESMYKMETTRTLVRRIVYWLFKKKDYKQEKKWCTELLKCDIADYSCSEIFSMAQCCFELEEYDEAYLCFSIAYDRGKRRAFPNDEDIKYWHFFKARRDADKTFKSREKIYPVLLDDGTWLNFGEKKKTDRTHEVKMAMPWLPPVTDDDRRSAQRMHIIQETSRGVSFEANKQYRDAINVYSAAWHDMLNSAPPAVYDHDQAPWLIMLLVRACFSVNDYQQAKQCASEGIKCTRIPEDYPAAKYLDMGAACFELDQQDDAFNWFLQGYEIGKYQAFREYHPDYWEFFKSGRKRKRKPAK